MFVAVEIKESDKEAGFAFLKKRKSAELIKKEIFGGHSFYVLRVCRRKGTIPYDDIEKVLKQLSLKAVLPFSEGFEKRKIRRFEAEKLPLKVLFNSLVKYFSTQNIRFGHLTVFDKNAVLSDGIERLVPFCGNISIISEKGGEYEEIRNHILFRYGLSVVVKEKFSDEIGLSDGIITEKADLIPLSFQGAVYTLYNRTMMGPDVISPEEIILPQKYEKLVPVGADRILFASALYELCGVRELENTEIKW